MSSTVPRWQDAWATRYPDGYVVNDLTPDALASWRAMARQEEASGYVVPHTTTPSAGQATVPREMQSCPSLRWMRGRV
jgi:hypothetical protein